MAATLSANPKTPPEGFPIHLDGDSIRYFDAPFTLRSWVDTYPRPFQLFTEEELRTAIPNCPIVSGVLLKREVNAVIQALITSVIEYHDSTGRPHGNLSDLNNIILHQEDVSYWGAYAIVKFNAELVGGKTSRPDSNQELQELTDDMVDVHNFLKIFQSTDVEFNQMMSCLSTYPYTSPGMKELMLNHPALWDTRFRRSILLLLPYRLYADEEMAKSISSAVCYTDWVKNVPQGSIFDKLLVDHANTSKSGGSEIVHALAEFYYQYYDVWGGKLDDRLVQLFLTKEIFPCLITKLYFWMCQHNRYL